MYMSYLLMKARHEEMLRAAAQHRLAPMPASAHRPPSPPIAAPGRRLAVLRLRKLFS